MHYNGGYLIGQINKLTSRKVNELLKKEKVSDFNGAQGTIMYVLYGRKQMSIKEICEATGLAKTSLTSMLERMEQRGLIEKSENVTDRRSTLVRLTEKAKKQKRVIKKVADRVTRQYYKGMKEEEIRQFERLLERVLSNLQEE